MRLNPESVQVALHRRDTWWRPDAQPHPPAWRAVPLPHRQSAKLATRRSACLGLRAASWPNCQAEPRAQAQKDACDTGYKPRAYGEYDVPDTPLTSSWPGHAGLRWADADPAGPSLRKKPVPAAAAQSHNPGAARETAPC